MKVYRVGSPAMVEYTARAICPVCLTRWGVPIPPISVCPSHRIGHDFVVVSVGLRLPPGWHKDTITSDIPRWERAGWNMDAVRQASMDDPPPTYTFTTWRAR